MAQISGEENQVFALIAAGDAEALGSLLARNPALARARNEEGLSACLFARYHNQRPALEALLATNPTLDAFEAAALGRWPRLRELLSQDPGLARAFSTDGFTALHLACFFGHPETVQGLLEHGVEVNAVARNPSQVQPLHSAAAGRKKECVELLLTHDADVAARQQGGWTALQQAAHSNDLDMVRLLLDHGADPAQPMDDGKTALDLLPDGAGAEIRELLAG